MRLLSVNVALPEEVQIGDRVVRTGIDKRPAAKRLWLGRLNVEGDGQADLTVHGGEHQAAYAYPYEHYAHWAAVLGRDALPYGTFGENFTTSGLLETEVHVGDVLRVGEATVQVTLPRLPCFKFGHKIGQPTLIKEFLQSGRSGFYLRVLVEGEVGANDPIEVIERESAGISIRAALGMQKLGEGDAELLRRTLAIESLAPLLRTDLEKRLAQETEEQGA